MEADDDVALDDEGEVAEVQLVPLAPVTLSHVKRSRFILPATLTLAVAPPPEQALDELSKSSAWASVGEQRL